MCTLVPGFNTSACCSFLTLPLSGVLLRWLRMQSSSPLIIDCSELESQVPTLEIICRFNTSRDFAVYFIPPITVPFKFFFPFHSISSEPLFYLAPNLIVIYCGVFCGLSLKTKESSPPFSYFATPFTVHINNFAVLTMPKNDGDSRVSWISEV